MDIQGWLQGTADRAPPNPPDEPDALDFLQAAHSVETTRPTRYHRKHQRAATDSSIIAPQQKAGNRSKVGGQSAGVGRGRHAHKKPSQSESASRKEPSRPASQENGRNARREQPDSNTYERRARHKTKPDRYEPKTTEKRQRKRDGSVEERKPKQKSRHVHRGGDGKRTESLVQGFRLKNGPSKSRLTLKPDVGAGMFRHGRASAQMIGRSNGLPDLAFNELKFLRESNEHQDEQNLVDGNMRKSNNQDRKRDAEREEISAYFDQRNRKNDSAPDRRTARRSNLVVDDEMLTDHEDVREGGSSPRLPNGELTAIPYLGFGSKGTIGKSTNPPPSTTTYLTWSESGDGLATSGKSKPAFKTALETGQLTVRRPTAVRRSKHENHFAPANDMSKEPDRNRIDALKRRKASPRRIRVPEKINVYTDLGIAEPIPSTEMLRDSKSQSLPTEQPKKSTHDQRKRAHAAGHAKTPSSDGESFRTSDILKIRRRLQGLADIPPSELTNTQAPPRDKENVPPASSSSPTAKILRTAHGAMMQHQLEMSVQSPIRIRQSNTFDAFQHEHPSYHPMVFQHQPGPHLRDPSEENFEHPADSNLAFLKDRYVEQQEWQDAHDAYDETVDPEDEEMLDTYAVGELEHQSIENDAGDLRSAYVFSTPGMNVRSLSRQDHRPPTRGRDTPWSRSGITTIRGGTSSYNTLTEQDRSIGEDRIVDRKFEDGLEGFWRPNRLY